MGVVSPGRIVSSAQGAHRLLVVAQAQSSSKENDRVGDGGWEMVNDGTLLGLSSGPAESTASHRGQSSNLKGWWMFIEQDGEAWG